jgi:hypothetical protein
MVAFENLTYLKIRLSKVIAISMFYTPTQVINEESTRREHQGTLEVTKTHLP